MAPILRYNNVGIVLVYQNDTYAYYRARGKYEDILALRLVIAIGIGASEILAARDVVARPLRYSRYFNK